MNYKCIMIGFAADRAMLQWAVIIWYKRYFKKNIPDLFVVTCICELLQVCSNAENSWDLLYEIYSYFKYSYKKQKNSQFQGHQASVENFLYKILQSAKTHRLSLHSAVRKRILEQYNPLILYFTIVAFKEKTSSCWKIFSETFRSVH